MTALELRWAKLQSECEGRNQKLDMIHEMLMKFEGTLHPFMVSAILIVDSAAFVSDNDLVETNVTYCLRQKRNSFDLFCRTFYRENVVLEVFLRNLNQVENGNKKL